MSKGNRPPARKSEITKNKNLWAQDSCVQKLTRLNKKLTIKYIMIPKIIEIKTQGSIFTLCEIKMGGLKIMKTKETSATEKMKLSDLSAISRAIKYLKILIGFVNQFERFPV